MARCRREVLECLVVRNAGWIVDRCWDTYLDRADGVNDLFSVLMGDTRSGISAGGLGCSVACVVAVEVLGVGML